MNTPTSDRESLDSFDLALLHALRQEVGARSRTSERRPGRRRGLAAAGVAAAAAAAFAVTSLGAPAAAFAVDQSSAGDIAVTLHRLDDADGLEQALAAKGITANVHYRPTSAGEAPSAPILDEAPGALESGGSALSGSTSASATLQGETGDSAPVTGVCGDPANPALTTQLNRDNFVITIPAGSALHRADSELEITTSGGVEDSFAGLDVSYTVDGTRCGVGSASATAVPLG